MFKRRQKLTPFVEIGALQPYNYQVSKEVVHKIKFGAVAVMQIYSDRYFNTDWQYEMSKRGKDNGHDTLYKC